MTKKNYIILASLIILLLGASFIFYINSGMFSAKKDTSIILYIQDGCPHCAIVEDYLKANDVASKFSFVQKDITNNTSNKNDLFDKVRFCGWENNHSIGTPFLWDGLNSECLMGDEDVVNFFKSQIVSSTTNLK
jgi:glutaredoxin